MRIISPEIISPCWLSWIAVSRWSSRRKVSAMMQSWRTCVVTCTAHGSCARSGPCPQDATLLFDRARARPEAAWGEADARRVPPYRGRKRP